MRDTASVWLLIFIFYFIPAMTAKFRRHKNAGAITVLNIFLGWSIIGWVVALVWACTDGGHPVKRYRDVLDMLPHDK